MIFTDEEVEIIVDDMTYFLQTVDVLDHNTLRRSIINKIETYKLAQEATEDEVQND
jgi:hypothetical protein